MIKGNIYHDTMTTARTKNNHQEIYYGSGLTDNYDDN